MPPDRPSAQNDVKALLEAGFNSHAKGDLSAARTCYERALGLAPDNVHVMYALGSLAQARGELATALGYFERAVRLAPDNVAFHANQGIVLAEMGRPAEAASCFKRVAALEPQNPEHHFNLGTLLVKAGQGGEAISCFARAVALNPDDAEFQLNLGLAHAGVGQLKEAVPAFEKAISLGPRHAQSHYQLGIVRARLEQLQAAAACFEKAIALDPAGADYHYNLGWMMNRLGQMREAIACFEKAVALKPDDAEFQFNLSTAHLALGDFARGWPRNQWRLRYNPASYENPKRLPLVGPQTPGTTPVLVIREQGFGDDLQFCRYIPLLQARFPRLRLRARPELARLLRASFDSLEIYTDPAADEATHAILPLMSAPWVLGTTLETIPATLPYLKVPSAARRWALSLPPTPQRRVGLVWGGRPDIPGISEFDARRSIPVEHIKPLLDETGITWISLQVGRPDDLRALREAGHALQDYSAHISDFADTAALIEQLDLVIAVDTAVVHLAGALGKPVWLLNRFDSCWRWFRDRDDSPWYPTLRIFRQQTPGDWGGVIAQVKAALADLPGRPR